MIQIFIQRINFIVREKYILYYKKNYKVLFLHDFVKYLNTKYLIFDNENSLFSLFMKL